MSDEGSQAEATQNWRHFLASVISIDGDIKLGTRAKNFPYI